MMDLSIPYYEDNTRISNSAIGWFLKNGPFYLHKKLTGLIPDEKGPQLERGTMIHEYILQPDEFGGDYIVAPAMMKRPISDKQEAFCNSLLKSIEIEPDKRLLAAYKANYSIVGKSEAKMLSEATEMANSLKDYIDLKKDGRIIITDRDVQKCSEVSNNISEHKFASKILNDKDEDWEEHHEFHINWEFMGVKCKSLLDCVKFNFKKHICQIIDLKTTVKLWHFHESIEKYDYLRQLCFYYLAAKWYLENELQINLDDWEFEFYIVAIDSTQTSDIRVFVFSWETVETRYSTIVDALKKIKWHEESGKWDHTYEYYQGNGCEELYLEYK